MKQVKCSKCHQTFEMPDNWVNPIICESCDTQMNPRNQWRDALDGDTLKKIKRLCDIVVNNPSFSAEADSLALHIGNHPTILNSENNFSSPPEGV